jgi:DnaJ-class molecular chaperone
MRRDYYAVLGIAATAEPREIRHAYRRLARQYSPDVNFWDESARGLFEEIAEAYRVLSDPTARDMYGPLRLDPRRRGGAGPGRRGDDVHVTADVSFAEVAHGVNRNVEVVRYSACRMCGARGRGASGAPCPPCGGRGVTRATETVVIAIPPGVDSGVQLRVAGEGSTGPLRWTPRRSDRQHARGGASVLHAQGRQRPLRGGPSACGKRCAARASSCRRHRARPSSSFPPGNTVLARVFRLREARAAASRARWDRRSLRQRAGRDSPTDSTARTDELVP